MKRPDLFPQRTFHGRQEGRPRFIGCRLGVVGGEAGQLENLGDDVFSRPIVWNRSGDLPHEIHGVEKNLR